MSMLIKDRRLAADDWRVAHGAGDVDTAAAGENLIVPLPVWKAQRSRLLSRQGQTGVWLAPAEEPAELIDGGPLPELIAVQFPAFTDGRGYSTARLLRERYGYRGELRAIGDVQRDQLFELARVGFDAFALREGQDAAAALRAFADFSEVYQAAADRGPLFVRRFSASPNREHR
jgi:uncharacterized protein (DUF934 family)